VIRIDQPAPPLLTLVYAPLPTPINLADTFFMTATAQPTQSSQGAIRISPGPRMKTALLLAILADIVQLIIFPLFVEGAAFPPDDILDLCMAGILSWLLGWHWEFLPSFAGKLIPGVDLVPLWTLAVANVYRKSRPRAATVDRAAQGPPTGEGSLHS